MANTLKIKRRINGSAGGASSPTALAWGELALNENNDVLYYGKGSGAGGAISIIPIGGPGAYVGLGGTQTINGAKTFAGTVSLGSNATASTPSSPDNSDLLATTAFVKNQGYLNANGQISGDTRTKITYDGNGLVTEGADLTAADIPALTAAKISNFDTQVRTNRLDQLAAPTAGVSLNGKKITNLATPTADSDAATKGYVDAARAGLDVKESARLATTENHSLSGLAAIDGITPVSGERVLVKNQTNAPENGLYLSSSGTWARTTDADVNAEVTPGLFVFVESGTVNADTGWVLTTDVTPGTSGAAISLGSTPLIFAQFSGVGAITAGAGLTQTGTTINVVTTANGAAGRLLVSSDSVSLESTGIGTGTATKVTFDTYGRITATSTPTTLSGYSITDAQPLTAVLTSITNASINADQIFYGTGPNAVGATDLTAFGRSLIDDTNSTSARATLGLGNLATQNGTFSGTSSGTNTGDQTTVSGNAGSATVLQTARLINGVSFDGSSNITVTAAAGTLTGTGLASNVVASSLTSVGVLTSLNVNGATSISGVLLVDNSATINGNLQIAGSLDNATIDGGAF